MKTIENVFIELLVFIAIIAILAVYSTMLTDIDNPKHQPASNEYIRDHVYLRQQRHNSRRRPMLGVPFCRDNNGSVHEEHDQQ